MCLKEFSVTYPGHLGARYTSLGAQTLTPKKCFLTFCLKISFKHPWRSVSLFNLRNLENVLQRNLRTGTARECIFRASGGTRLNFCQPWWRKGGGETPRCNRSAQKNSGYVTGFIFQIVRRSYWCCPINLDANTIGKE